MNLCDPDGNRIPRATAKSSVITKSLNPYWGEEHILPVPKSMLSKFRNRGPLLELGVFDSDGKMQKDDFLGGSVVIMNTLPQFQKLDVLFWAGTPLICGIAKRTLLGDTPGCRTLTANRRLIGPLEETMTQDQGEFPTEMDLTHCTTSQK